MLIHAFVRDEIRFGWQPALYEVRASDVLDAGVGDCATKGNRRVERLRTDPARAAS